MTPEEWFVEIRDYVTADPTVVKSFGPYPTERAAERMEDAVNINLNHERFYTVVTNEPLA